MMPPSFFSSRLYTFGARQVRQKKLENEMRKLPWVALSLLLAFSMAGFAQNSNTSSKTSKANANKNSNANRRPIFRATADQIKQAQALLKQRNLYTGEQTGKLDTGTRAGLKEYQKAESLKVTGTLNKITLEKMGIALTDKQKTM